MANSAIRRLNPTPKYSNFLINSNFDHWQYGTSVQPGVTSAHFAADRWWLDTSGSGTFSRQSFTLGQTAVPNNPTYYLQYSHTGTNGFQAGQRIEKAASLSGQTVTVNFWANGNANTGTMSVQFNQFFGTGGSPSSTVSTSAQTFTCPNGTWTNFTFTFALPSVSGKTLGSNGDDYLELVIYTAAAGSNNPQFQLSQCILSASTTATPWSYSTGGILPSAAEFAACQRYYQIIGPGAAGVAESTTAVSLSGNFVVPMRATPTITAGTATYTIRHQNADSTTSAAPTLANQTATPSGWWLQITNFTGLTAAAVATDRGSTTIGSASAEL